MTFNSGFEGPHYSAEQNRTVPGPYFMEWNVTVHAYVHAQYEFNSSSISDTSRSLQILQILSDTSRYLQILSDICRYFQIPADTFRYLQILSDLQIPTDDKQI